jgi:signal peptidase II
MAVTPRHVGLLAAVVTLIVDQVDKHWMIFVFDIGGRPPIKVLPFLEILMAWNPGISYSLLPADNLTSRLLLLSFAGIAVLLLGIWLWRSRYWQGTLGLGMIIGGALGNAWDRFAYGAVADFFHFYTPMSLGPLSNYVFNLADVGIVAGVGLLLYESFFIKEKQPASVAES